MTIVNLITIPLRGLVLIVLDWRTGGGGSVGAILSITSIDLTKMFRMGLCITYVCKHFFMF